MDCKLHLKKIKNVLKEGMREHSYFFCFIDREAFPRVTLLTNAPTNIHTLLSLSLMGKDSYMERVLDYLTTNDSLPITAAARRRWDPCLKIVNGGQFNLMMIVDLMPIR